MRSYLHLRLYTAVSASVALASMAFAQISVELVPVESRATKRVVELPGEFLPYESVALHARVPGFVDRVLVDRGSHVKKGELLAELSAPEMTAQISEAKARVEAARSDAVNAESQLTASRSTFERLKKAAETPGAIAGNELIQAEEQVKAGEALVRSRQEATRAAEAALRSFEDMRSYLRVTAPFDGVVTDRLVHPGALVKPDAEPALFNIEQIARLRLVVAIPEQNAGRVPMKSAIPFQVPAFPQRTFTGTVARVSHALDVKTRTLPVELDVVNRDGSLAPGMYPSVRWPVASGEARLVVPQTAVVTTTERRFVIRVRGNRAEWVDVKKGPTDGDLVEIAGAIQADDMVVRRATDEIHDGSTVKVTKKH